MAKHTNTKQTEDKMAKVPDPGCVTVDSTKDGKKRAACDPSHSNVSGNEPRDVGDIEEETLDRDAPYNKTYGLKDHS